jgi:transcriptional regulator with XRE-family HTH domain
MTPEQCKAARAMAGLSQQALADAAKVAKATVTAFERGNRKPYERTLTDMQSALVAHGVQFTPDGVQMARAS